MRSYNALKGAFNGELYYLPYKDINNINIIKLFTDLEYKNKNNIYIFNK